MHFHLTQEQRIELSLLRRLGHSQRNIALVLGVNPSTICRELKRNVSGTGGYHAREARLSQQARRSAANALRNKLLANPKLAALVTRKLTRNDSPEEIAGWLPEVKRVLRVSSQTIYDWVYSACSPSPQASPLSQGQVPPYPRSYPPESLPGQAEGKSADYRPANPHLGS